MAEFAVECVDRQDGRRYYVRVDAPTSEDAVAFVSREHIAGRAVPAVIEFPAPSPDGLATDRDAATSPSQAQLLAQQVELLRSIDTRLNWFYLQERSAFTHLSRYIAFTIVFLLVSSVVAFIFGGLILGR